jgi:hypothetical protein
MLGSAPLQVPSVLLLLLAAGAVGCASNAPTTGSPGEISSGSANGSSGSSGGSSGGGSSGTGSSGNDNTGTNPSGSSTPSGSGSAAGSGTPSGSGSIDNPMGDDSGTDDAGAAPPPSDGGSTTIPHGACLDGITNYETAGPFKYTATSSGSVKIWVPTVPSGCKVPMVHLANGTGATCSDYGDDLVRLATHGFLTLCYENTNTGAGDQGITAFTTAMSMYPDLFDKKLGSTGHSQGGQAAFTVLQLAEAKWGIGTGYIYAGLAMEPASGFGTQPTGGTWQQVYGKIKSPMFMFSGTADMLVSAAWVGEAYSAMNKANEVYWWSATGATHIPTPQVPEEQVSIPWFRWKLLGDNAACKFFKAMPGNTMISPGWTKEMSENEAPCQ